MSQPDHNPRTCAISIKGVVVADGKVLLLKNEREEWELPGGKIDLDETPDQCLAREIAEETQWEVTTGPILDTWMLHIGAADRHVFVVTYGCYPHVRKEPVLSHEHKEIGLFGEHEVKALNMPDGYKRSIATWYALLHDNAPELVG